MARLELINQALLGKRNKQSDYDSSSSPRPLKRLTRAAPRRGVRASSRFDGWEDAGGSLIPCRDDGSWDGEIAVGQRTTAENHLFGRNVAAFCVSVKFPTPEGNMLLPKTETQVYRIGISMQTYDINPHIYYHVGHSLMFMSSCSNC